MDGDAKAPFSSRQQLTALFAGHGRTAPPEYTLVWVAERWHIPPPLLAEAIEHLDGWYYHYQRALECYEQEAIGREAAKYRDDRVYVPQR